VGVLAAGGICRVLSMLQACPTGATATAHGLGGKSSASFRSIALSADSTPEGDPEATEVPTAAGIAACIRILAGLMHCGIVFREQVGWCRVCASCARMDRQ
jgi:hypothetical protein